MIRERSSGFILEVDVPTIVPKSESIMEAGCKNMQSEINEQMTIGRNAGYPFPNFSNMWLILKNALPPIQEIKRLSLEDRTSFEYDEMVWNAYMAFKNALASADRGFAHMEDEFFVFRNVRNIIKNGTYWIAVEWDKVDEDEQQPWSGPIAVDAPQHDVVQQDIPSFQVGPVGPTTPGGSTMLPGGATGGGGQVYTPTTPGIGGDQPAYGDDDWTFPEFEWPTMPQAEQKPSMAMIAALGLGAVAVILLLKK